MISKAGVIGKLPQPDRDLVIDEYDRRSSKTFSSSLSFLHNPSSTALPSFHLARVWQGMGQPPYAVRFGGWS
jgi:hypothetical protein